MDQSSKLCHGCRKNQALPGFSRCANCQKKDREKWQRRRAKNTAAGKCICGGDRLPGRRSCQRCLDSQARRHDKMLTQGRCTGCGGYNVKTGKRCDECRRKDRDARRQVRDRVLTAYGSKCKCCGETRKEFLQIDHVNNDGAEHRRQIGTGSKIFYWLIRNGFPDGFQILCANCNYSKEHYGYCPHHPDKEVNDGKRTGYRKNRTVAQGTSC